MNNQVLNSDSLMETLPSVLKKDTGMNRLAQTTAFGIEKVLVDLINSGIYYRLGELDDDLLDVLAEDLGIYWYNYDYKLETKRRIVAAAFYVHRHMGTKGALVEALSSIWPNSTIEEWFEYGGDPFSFRAVVEASEHDSEQIHIEQLQKTINLYKNARSWLEAGAITIRVTFGIQIGTDSKSHIYHTPVSGTLPRWKNHGSMENDGLMLGTGSGSAIYSVRRCGQPAGL